MTALFPRWTNTFARWSLLAIASLAVGVPVALMVWVRTSYATGKHAVIAQPVPFDHRVHAGALRIDCRFCHASVERAATAGLPPTVSCVGCHHASLVASSVFAPVRTSLATQRPIPWRRVNALPDFVFFNHSIHVARGVRCETCHGDVRSMARVQQATSLSMGWCLGCHRNPIAEPGVPIAVDQGTHARLTNCSTCHR